MKRLILTIAVITAMACVLPAQGQDKKFREYGVAFYNLENLFDTIPNNPRGYDAEFTPAGKNKWDGSKYWKKIQNMGYALSKMTTKNTPEGPAVIGVSEIENITVLQDLVASEPLRKWNLQIVHHDSPDLRGVDVGLLYNPSQFRVINVTNHVLSIPKYEQEKGRPFLTRDQMCVVGLLGKSPLAIIVNHWPSRRGGEEQSSYLREAAAELSRHIADSVTQAIPNIGVIIMGDLNDDPMNKSCAKVLPALKDEKKVKPGEFYNPFWKKLDDGIGSYTYRGGWNLFDQIIVSYNLLPEGKSRLKYRSARVFNEAFLKQTSGQYKGYPFRTFAGGVWQGGYSDHFPTEIFLIEEL